MTLLSRRQFVRSGLSVAGGLLVGARLGWANPRLSAAEGFKLCTWIWIEPKGDVHFILDRVEMGQGVMTSLTAIVAEELDLDPFKIRVHFAPPGKGFGNPRLFNTQITGGSTSIAGSWDPLRRAAAAVRAVLIDAAAIRLHAKPDNCRIENFSVVDGASGRQVSFGEIVEEAASRPLPLFPKPKDPAQYRLLGKPMKRYDNWEKVTGRAQYGIDVNKVRIGDVDVKPAVCVVVRCPVPDGRLQSFELQGTPGSGFLQLIPLKSGVAVLASSYWEALRTSKQVTVQWDLSRCPRPSSDDVMEDYRRSSAERGTLVTRIPTLKSRKRMEKELLASKQQIQALYELPYLPHATMEPMNCTASVRPDFCEIWAPTQAPAAAREIAAQITGLSHRQIKVNTTFLGGGFGRRLYQDYVAEAVQISRDAKMPVQVIWTREDDFQHDYYRPATVHAVRAALTPDGSISHWMHHVVGQSIFRYIADVFANSLACDAVSGNTASSLGAALSGLLKRAGRGRIGFTDPTSVEGIVTDATMPNLQHIPYQKTIPYKVANFRLEFTHKEPEIRVGFWRSVGHSHTAFVIESMIDELAHLAGADPYQFRMNLIQDRKYARNKRVLQIAAEKAGWSNPPAPGIFRGIAQHKSFDSCCAHVIEISMPGGKLKLHRVVSAVDCGFVLNPGLVTAQAESAVIFGLTAALKLKITVDKGAVQQSSYNDCDLLRMYEVPRIEVHLVPSEEPPSGIGEPCVPPIAPALCNALFAATGIRHRKLPVRLSDF